MILEMQKVAAREYAEKNQLPYLSPYNDEDVIAGQGTIGIEILKEQDRMDAVFIAVGGGGLIAGVGSYLKEFWSRMRNHCMLT